MTDTIAMTYDRLGTGDPVVLLHGGFTDARMFTGNLDALADAFTLYVPDRRGHGRTPDPGPITGELMAADTVAFLEEVVRGPAALVGYSAGGLVALLTAVRRPDLVTRLALISAAYDPAGMIFKPEAGGQMPGFIVDAYSEVSPDGREHFPAVQEKVVAMIAKEAPPTAAQLATVPARTLVVAADDDIVTLEHTLELYRALPHAELAVLPNASHGLLDEHPAQVAALVRRFLADDPVPTVMPVRRAGSFGGGSA